MQAGAVAKRYAQAAFEVAQSRGLTDRWLEDLRRLGAAIADPAVTRWLDNSKVPAARKEDVLVSVLDSPDPQFLNFIRLLLARNRATLFPQIAISFERIVNQARRVGVAQVTTAVPIDAAEEARIAQHLSEMTGLTIEVQTRVDPDIMGGFVARVGDRVIDGSVRTRLERLRRQLAGVAS